MKKLAFIVPSAFEMLDLSGPVQVFTEAQEYGMEISIEFYSLKPNVVSAAGLPVGKIDNFRKADLKKGDFIFIPGVHNDALEGLIKSDPIFIEWLKKCYDQEINVCSICTGAFVLAEAGLLDHKKSTTHWRRAGLLKERYPKTKVVTDVLFVKNENIYTSAGISAGIDMALDILEELKGPRFTHKVARGLVVYQRRSSDHEQNSVYLDYRNHINPSIHEVQDYLTENIDSDITIDMLASMVAMSPRNLTRVFKDKTGLTIWQYLTKLRAEKARLLLHDPSNTMDYVAQQCGFKSSRQLQRILKNDK